MSKSEDGDNQDSESSEEPVSERPSPAPARPEAEPRRRVKKKRRRVEEPVEVDEEKIDSPNRQTMGMLIAVAAATLLMWGVGRAKCNYSGPGEGMQPRALSVEELTKTPKDAAFEFHQRLESYDFETALKLAKGNAKKLVEERQAACKASGNCEQKRSSLQDKVFSTAALLERTPTGAVATARSVGGESAGTYRLVLEREGDGWKVAQYAPDLGKPQPSTPTAPGSAIPEPSAAPPGSAEAAASGAPSPAKDLAPSPAPAPRVPPAATPQQAAPPAPAAPAPAAPAPVQ